MEKALSLFIVCVACAIAVFFALKHQHLTEGLQYQEGKLYNIQRESSVVKSGAVRQYYRWVVEFEDEAGQKQLIVLADMLTSLRPATDTIRFYYNPQDTEKAYLARGVYSLNLVYIFAFLGAMAFVAFLAFLFERKRRL